MNYNGFILDFDGTIANTSEGVTNSVKYALEKMNLPTLEEKQLHSFIGPSLYHSFSVTVGLNEKETEKAIAYYREYYIPHGVYQCKLYDGMEELLRELSQHGTVTIASAKPQPQLEIVVKHLGLDKYVKKVVGASLSTRDNDKAIQLKEATLTEKSVMIGDSPYDIQASKRVGLPCIAVAYGFTTIERLEKECPEKIANSVAHLREILLG